MKTLTVLVIALLLAACSAAFGVVDVGGSAVTRLWNGTGFVCSAAYIRPYEEAGAWILSAGHCVKQATYAKRTANDFISAYIDWRLMVQTHNRPDAVADIALGTAPDPRIGERKWYSFLGEQMPEVGTRVYVHGFPAGVERVIPAIVVGKAKEYPNAKWNWEIETPAVGDIVGGASGAPVLDANGYVVGVVWGIRTTPVTHEYTNRAIVTDIAALHALVKEMGLKLE